MSENGNGTPVGLSARASQAICGATSRFHPARARLGDSPWATRYCVQLVAVASLSMVALGWWIDQYGSMTLAATTGQDAVAGRTQVIVAVALVWGIIVGAIVLIFRRQDLAKGGRNTPPDNLHNEGIGQRIHDGPAQMLTFVMLRLDELEHLLRDSEGGTHPAARQIIQDVRSATVDALNDLRQISRQLTRQS